MRNIPAGKSLAANTILKEIPNDPTAKKALGFIYSDVIGWVKGEDAQYILDGKLPFGNRWLPAKEVMEYRKDWVNSWEISEGNFRVRTNTSPELARKLLQFFGAL